MPKQSSTPVVIDADGSEAVSNVLLELLNEFPGLKNGERIKFSALEDDSGIGFFPTSGAALQINKEDILGHVYQVCQYPFTVVYRTAARSDTAKLKVKEFLDTLGKWLERQPVAINGTRGQLSEYPKLSAGNRVIKSIERTSQGYLNAAYGDKVEDWVISIMLSYENEFYK